MKNKYLVLFLAIFCLFAMVSCNHIAKKAYEVQHKNDAPLNPQMTEGATIIYKSDGVTLKNVVDIEYDKKDRTVHYTRRINGDKFVTGIAKYDDVDIIVGEGYLRWSDKINEWEYVEAGRAYGIYQHSYVPIEISGEDPQKTE